MNKENISLKIIPKEMIRCSQEILRLMAGWKECDNAYTDFKYTKIDKANDSG